MLSKAEILSKQMVQKLRSKSHQLMEQLHRFREDFVPIGNSDWRLKMSSSPTKDRDRKFKKILQLATSSDSLL